MNLIPQLDIIQTHLQTIGYQGNTGIVVPNYEFVGKNGKTIKTDYVAFSDPYRHDISTACITVKWWPNGQDKKGFLENVSYIGTPVTIFVSDNKIELYPLTNQLENVSEQWEINRLEEFFMGRANDLKPTTLHNAKKYGKQLTFFHIEPNLEALAREATQKVLVECFTQALNNILKDVVEGATPALLRIAIWTLAARILQDKLNEESLKTRDVFELFTVLKKRFTHYFSGLENDISQIGESKVTQFYSDLLTFTFRSLTNDMLAYFYENALVDENLRRKLGIYYTPRFLSEMMLHRLPIEDFPIDKRVIMDGTCGSGSLLLASYNRLKELLPVRWTLEQKHEYLLNHIYGIDIDPFACEIARLSLLLYDLPAGNDWQIQCNNIFDLKNNIDVQPFIIVGNPPFKEIRTSPGEREQQAAKVLQIYLNTLTENGLLAVVMPLTFLTNKSTYDIRSLLLKNCDVYEVWHFYKGVIPSWSPETAIIIACKQTNFQSNNLPTRIIEVMNIDGLKFREYGKTTLTYTISQNNWLNNEFCNMSSSFIDDILDDISHKFIPIHPQYCQMFNGVKPGRVARQTHLEENAYGQQWRRALTDRRNGSLEPYRIYWQNQNKKYIKYPSPEIEGPRQLWHFEVAKKIIFNKVRNASSPWRLIASVDSEQLIPLESFHYGLAQNIVTAEEIVAVLNSSLANAWYSKKYLGSNIILEIIQTLPFPIFEPSQRERILKLVNQINKKIGDTHKAILELDEIVFEAYGLSAEQRQRISQYMSRSGRPRPGQEWENETYEQPTLYEPYTGEIWRMVGEVLEVSAKDNSILIEPDYGEPQKISIPDTMPGWVMRPEVAFEAIIPLDQAYETDLNKIRWLQFKPLGYGYMNTEELLEAITPHQK